MDFSKEEIEQFSRQLILKGFDLKTQLRLKSTELRLSDYDFLSLRLFQGLGIGRLILQSGNPEASSLAERLPAFAPGQDYRVELEAQPDTLTDCIKPSPLNQSDLAESLEPEKNALLSEFKEIPESSVKNLSTCLQIARKLLEQK